MGKQGEYHKLEDEVDCFATYLRWAQFLRAAVVALLTQALWPYLDYLEPHSSPFDFIRAVVFATLMEVFAGVWQVHLDHKRVPILWYALSLVSGLLGSGLYLLPQQTAALLPDYTTAVGCVVLGRVLLAFWSGEEYAGSAAEIERLFVLLSPLSSERSHLLASFERMRITGYISGTLLGLTSTYLPVDWPWFSIEHIRYPAAIQALAFLVGACWLLSVFGRFMHAVNSEKETIIEPSEPVDWMKRMEGCGEDDRKKIKHVSESLRHWGVFSGLFSNIVLHFSSQVRDVVFPILLLPDSSEFTDTAVENEWKLAGVYSLFAVGSLVGFLGRELWMLSCRYLADRTTLLLLLLLTAAGWTILIPTRTEATISIGVQSLISGFVLVSLGTASLPECSYKVYHRVLGPKSSGFYMVMFLLLGGMGAAIAPLWVWETMRLDSALCFGFVDVWLGAMVIILVTAWNEAVPYHDFMTKFVEKIPQKGKIEAS